jgi:hypothetical protein
LGNIDATVEDADILAVFYPYGRVVAMNVVGGNAKNAFVELSCRTEAESALQGLRGNVYLNGRLAAVNWAKPRKEVSIGISDSTGGVDEADSAPALSLLPPPGLGRAPVSSYSLLAAEKAVCRKTARDADADDQFDHQDKAATNCYSTDEEFDDNDPYLGPLFKKLK